MQASKYNRGPLLVLLLAIFLPNIFLSQISAYFDSNIFNTPQNQPFVETHLTIVGKSLVAKDEGGFFQNSANIALVIYKDTGTIPVKINKYNLHSPAFATPTTAPTFIDNQRYSLPNGTYRLELTLADNHNPALKPLVIKQTVKIKFDDKTIQSSDVQALESFKKTSLTTPLTKSGYELVPYSVNYYPETSNQLAFYMETYNTDKTLGANRPMVYHYYLELADKLIPLSTYGSFKKQLTSSINPLLAKIDITKLGTGNYNLVVELRDSANIMHVKQKYFFQRLNRNVDIAALQVYSENKTVADYFGACNNVDTLKMFVECLWPIAGTTDKERIINQSIKKDPILMKNFVIDFWQRRAADTANPLKLWAAYYQNVQKVMALFKCGKQKGYYTDRGRVFLQYGPPSQRAVQLVENNTFPYEIWQYYSTVDAVNGFTSTNRKFVFVNKMLGDDCFMLVHSDMRGEINNPRWQFETSRRNYNGIANPDATKPQGTENNQFDDLYSNPR
jgi:GWxTD domain-containing protein